MNAEEQGWKLLRGALVDLEPACGGLDRQALDDLARWLMGTAVKVTRVARYVSTRSLGGSHQQAVKDQNKAAAAVRRALGYTYPRDDISF